MKKFVAFVVCSLILVSSVNAHFFRRARVQYTIVDPCGCVEMRVDEAKGTVTAKKLEIKRELEIRRNIRTLPTPAPIIHEEPKPETNDLPGDEIIPDEVKEERSILVISGDLPITK